MPYYFSYILNVWNNTIKTSMLDNFMTTELTCRISTTFRGGRLPLVKSVNVGQRLKRLNSRGAYTLFAWPFQWDLAYLFLRTVTGNICWKNSASLIQIQQVIELRLLSSALPSGGHWGVVIVTLYTWGCLLLHSSQVTQIIPKMISCHSKSSHKET